MIPKVVTNYAINPSAEEALSLIGTSSGTLSAQRSSENPRPGFGSFSFRLFWNTTPGTTTPQLRFQNIASVPSGQTRHFAIWIFCPLTNSSQPLSFTAQLRDDAAALTYQSYSGMQPISGPYVAGTWNQIGFTHTVPEGRTLGSVYWRMNHATVDQSDVYYMDCHQINDYPGLPYFDGSMANTSEYEYAWTGTPHLSTSTRTRIGPSGEVILNGMEKGIVARSVIVNGQKKSIVSRSVIVNGVKYPLIP